MSNHEIAELTWENGQLAMHEFGGIFAAASNKGPTWDTLESVVQQATISNKESGPIPVAVKNGGSVVASSGGRLVEKKRTRSESDQQMKLSCNEQDWAADISVCASANAAFCRESDRTMSTWASHESSRSTRTKTTEEDDSACHTGSENLEGRVNKSDTEHSNPVRKGRAAAVHNQSERRRRDRINQKMKALQKLVPNATKTDKASVLDEVIEYLKQLQAQVQMMSASSMTQHMMMMPLGMQQHLQMSSFLARAGMGMGMLNVAAAQTPPLFVPPVGPSSAPQQAKPDPVNTTSLVPLHDPYNAFLSQSMNMEMYNRMAALYGQQMNQSMKTSNHNPTQEG